MTSLSRVALAAALSLLALTPALAVDNYSITSGGASRTVRAKDIGAGVIAPMSIPIDSTGTERFTPTNPANVALPAGQVVDTIVRATSVDRGALLTTAGTAQTLVPANAARRGLAIQNRNAPGTAYSAATSVFMSCVGTATQDFHSLEIPAGALYETPGHHTGVGACSFVSGTANTPVYVREF